jgi:hypothetical protein
MTELRDVHGMKILATSAKAGAVECNKILGERQRACYVSTIFWQKYMKNVKGFF